jgi:hypothetical protein
MIGYVTARHTAGPPQKENPTIPDTAIISGSPQKERSGVGENGYGLRPAPFPPHRILILIVALSHPDCRGTSNRADLLL